MISERDRSAAETGEVGEKCEIVREETIVE